MNLNDSKVCDLCGVQIETLIGKPDAKDEGSIATCEKCLFHAMNIKAFMTMYNGEFAIDRNERRILIVLDLPLQIDTTSKPLVETRDEPSTRRH